MTNRMTVTNAQPTQSISISDDEVSSFSKTFRDKQAWQVLLRRHEVDKSNETIQEEQQKQDDVHLRSNYYVHDAGTSMELTDVVIKTSVTEEMPFVENHIIIIGE